MSSESNPLPPTAPPSSVVFDLGRGSPAICNPILASPGAPNTGATPKPKPTTPKPKPQPSPRATPPQAQPQPQPCVNIPIQTSGHTSSNPQSPYPQAQNAGMTPGMISTYQMSQSPNQTYQEVFQQAGYYPGFFPQANNGYQQPPQYNQFPPSSPAQQQFYVQQSQQEQGFTGNYIPQQPYQGLNISSVQQQFCTQQFQQQPQGYQGWEQPQIQSQSQSCQNMYLYSPFQQP